MVNKKSIWFLTLFSLILVLSVYYITMPSELLMTNPNIDTDDLEPVISESSILVALRVDALEIFNQEMNNLQSILTNNEASNDQKNEAFDKMKELNNLRGIEEEIENEIKEQYSYESFVKITNDQIEIVIQASDHNSEVANDIIRLTQSKFDDKMYITVRFTS